MCNACKHNTAQPTHIVLKLILFLSLDKVIRDPACNGSRDEKRDQDHDARGAHTLGIVLHLELFRSGVNARLRQALAILVLGKVAAAVNIISRLEFDEGRILLQRGRRCRVGSVLGRHHILRGGL
jgi:hypothetical protein